MSSYLIIMLQKNTDCKVSNDNNIGIYKNTKITKLSTINEYIKKIYIFNGGHDHYVV